MLPKPTPLKLKFAYPTYGPRRTSERADEGSDQGKNDEEKERKKNDEIGHKMKERREGRKIKQQNKERTQS